MTEKHDNEDRIKYLDVRCGTIKNEAKAQGLDTIYFADQVAHIRRCLYSALLEGKSTDPDSVQFVEDVIRESTVRVRNLLIEVGLMKWEPRDTIIPPAPDTLADTEVPPAADTLRCPVFDQYIDL